MKILVLGAGAVGGYFGGRLLESGCDITFLVREARAARLAETGLVINSPAGDIRFLNPPVLCTSDIDKTFDTILVSCKAYQLENAMADFAPAIGPRTLIVPLLNGIRHLDVLDERFGPSHVAGGSCFISARLNEAGGIDHISEAHRVVFGPRSNDQVAQTRDIAKVMQAARFDVRHSGNIVLEMWEKWAFLASFAGVTCLTRAAIGDIIASGGLGLIEEMADECYQIATDAGSPPREENWEWMLGHLTDPESRMTASMLADLERGGPTEVEHIIGDMLARRQSGKTDSRSALETAYIAIRAAERRLGR